MTGDRADRRNHGSGDGIERERRAVLATGGAVLAAAAGVPVTSAEEGDGEFGEVDEDEELDEEEIITLYEFLLEDAGIQVSELAVEEVGAEELMGDVAPPDDPVAILSLEYYPVGASEEEIVEEMGTITGGFAGAVDLGLEVEQLQATALDLLDDEPISRWYVQTEWAEAYNADEMTAQELALEAFMTLESVE